MMMMMMMMIMMIIIFVYYVFFYPRSLGPMAFEHQSSKKVLLAINANDIFFQILATTGVCIHAILQPLINEDLNLTYCATSLHSSSHLKHPRDGLLTLTPNRY